MTLCNILIDIPPHTRHVDILFHHLLYVHHQAPTATSLPRLEAPDSLKDRKQVTPLEPRVNLYIVDMVTVILTIPKVPQDEQHTYQTIDAAMHQLLPPLTLRENSLEDSDIPTTIRKETVLVTQMVTHPMDHMEMPQDTSIVLPLET